MIAMIGMNIWGLLTMPIGVAICFGPVLAIWLREELRGGPPEKPDHQRSSQA